MQTRLSKSDRAAITSRAVAAAAEIARAHGISVSEPVILADRYAVRVHLAPAPLVARVSTFTSVLRSPIEPWLARELSVSAFLTARGAPVVAPSELVPPGPHTKDGFGISFWQHVPAISDEPPAPDVAGRMLEELHRALRDYPGELPLLAPVKNDIVVGLGRIERIGDVLLADDVRLLRRLAERWLPRIEAPVGPLQPLHGDAHVYNLIPSASGPVWNDFEDVCLGPIAWDLSSAAIDERLLAAYPGAPPAAELEPYRQLRLLQAAVFVYALLPEIDDWHEAARGILEHLRTLD